MYIYIYSKQSKIDGREITEFLNDVDITKLIFIVSEA